MGTPLALLAGVYEVPPGATVLDIPARGIKGVIAAQCLDSERIRIATTTAIYDWEPAQNRFERIKQIHALQNIPLRYRRRHIEYRNNVSREVDEMISIKYAGSISADGGYLVGTNLNELNAFFLDLENDDLLLKVDVRDKAGHNESVRFDILRNSVPLKVLDLHRTTAEDQVSLFTVERPNTLTRTGTYRWPNRRFRKANKTGDLFLFTGSINPSSYFLGWTKPFLEPLSGDRLTASADIMNHLTADAGQFRFEEVTSTGLGLITNNDPSGAPFPAKVEIYPLKRTDSEILPLVFKMESSEVTGSAIAASLFMEDEATVAALTYNGNVTLWDVLTGKKVYAGKVNITDPGIAYGLERTIQCANASKFLTLTRDEQLILWDLVTLLKAEPPEPEIDSLFSDSPEVSVLSFAQILDRSRRDPQVKRSWMARIEEQLEALRNRKALTRGSYLEILGQMDSPGLPERVLGSSNFARELTWALNSDEVKEWGSDDMVSRSHSAEVRARLRREIERPVGIISGTSKKTYRAERLLSLLRTAN